MDRKPTILLVVLASVSLLLITFDLTEKVIAFRTFIYYLLSPTPQLALKLIDKTEQLGENIVSFVRIHQENQFLKDKLQKLELVESQNLALLQENITLSSILKFRQFLQFEVISSRVISRDPSGWVKSIMIDKGESDSIMGDMPVITFIDNKINLIGRIINAEKLSSKILLITDSLSYVSVKIARSGETGVIVGKNDPELLLDYLLLESDIKLGDIVVTSGIGEVFPAGIPVGMVTDILIGKDNPYKQAIVKPLVSFNKISVVSVLNKKK